MPSNLEIAQSVTPRPIAEIAAAVGLTEADYEPYGRHKAKVRLSVLAQRRDRPDGKLVLVSAISPTPAGEGKTTMTIGLAQGLARLGKRCVAALREPSLGPVFGMKGGATGGGRAQLLPMEEINLHFTGDIHAITAANNLLAAVIDNHLQFGNALDLDPRTVTWKRCLDINDRSLRDVITGLGGRTEGVPRETGFEITAASEVMALFCLSDSLEDLRTRLGRIVVGSNRSGEPVTAAQLDVVGALTVLLRDALMPNLVQTMEGTPVLVHGGPFANIAHGCNSVIATKTALKLGDIVVTEAGFGADLGAEKFLNIKMRQSGLAPDAAVLVATVKALKMHGGVALADLAHEDIAAVERGLGNLFRHAENLRKFGLPVVVGINRFTQDTPAELEALHRLCAERGFPVAVANVWGEGGAGAEELGRRVLEALETPADFRTLYPDNYRLKAKIETIAREIYRARGVDFLPAAARRLEELEARGFGSLPVCIAKTQYSFSDNPKLLGTPEGHSMTVRDVKLSAGAGFVVAYSGTLLTMPGLPRRPASEDIDLASDGTILGLN